MMECICYLHEAFFCLTFDSFSDSWAYARQQAAGRRQLESHSALRGQAPSSYSTLTHQFPSGTPRSMLSLDLQLKSSLHVVRVEVCSAAALGGVVMGANGVMRWQTCG